MMLAFFMGWLGCALAWYGCDAMSALIDRRVRISAARKRARWLSDERAWQCAVTAAAVTVSGQAQAEVAQPILLSIEQMKTGAVLVATGFAVAAIALAAIKFLRKAGDGDTGQVQGGAAYFGNDTFADPDPAQVLEYPELYSDAELDEAIRAQAEDGLIEPDEVRHQFPELLSEDELDAAIRAQVEDGLIEPEEVRHEFPQLMSDEELRKQIQADALPAHGEWVDGYVWDENSGWVAEEDWEEEKFRERLLDAGDVQFDGDESEDLPEGWEELEERHQEEERRNQEIYERNHRFLYGSSD